MVLGVWPSSAIKPGENTGFAVPDRSHFEHFDDSGTEFFRFEIG
jgi:hypothetical protein